MILSRAPVRISLGGGGTDLKSYYSKYGGFLIAAGVNRYCYILASKRFKDDLRLSYSDMEITDKLDEVKHPIFREALRFIGIDSGIEVHSVGDVPAGSGLGASSSFTVALLNALHTYKREYVTQKQLAEEACHIEIDVLGNPIGKQDQYMGAFGGLSCLTFDKNGDVKVEPLNISEEAREQLEDNLQFFYTGQEHIASDILKEQDDKSKIDDPVMIDNLHLIKNIGLQTRSCLEKGQIDALGDLFDAHWQVKKMRSNKITSPFMDECYEEAMKNGALGGKLMGAGGGGFFVFYCHNGNKPKLSQAMKKMGLQPVRFHFDMEGAKILVNT